MNALWYYASDMEAVTTVCRKTYKINENSAPRLSFLNPSIHPYPYIRVTQKITVMYLI